jgi:hyperosmotically inducible periplasmic protein
VCLHQGRNCCVAVAVAAALLLSGCRTAAIDPLAIQDARTAAQVKTAIINDPDVGAMSIEVSVAQGVARLSGTVTTQAQIDRAAALARSVQGVRDVQLNLEIGAGANPVPETTPRGPSQSATDPLELRTADDPRLLAIGASLGRSGPRAGALDTRVSVGPLVRFGSGRGFGPAVTMNWFSTTLKGASPDPDVVSRIHVRPLMGGLGYTWAFDHVSVSPSIVGGIAFNSVSVPETGEAGRIAIEVGNSLVWQPGVSVWIDVNRRAAVNLSMGYVLTGLRVTFLENGHLVKHDVNGDTAIIHAGIAYKLF